MFLFLFSIVYLLFFTDDPDNDWGNMMNDEESEDDSLEEVMAGFISPDEGGWATASVVEY